MAADLHFSKNQEDQPLVIYAHGINGFKDWGGMDLVAKAFAENGLAFLKFNFSHNGTTPENPEEFVDLQAYGQDNYGKRQYDLKQVMDFASSEQLPVKATDLFLLGHSRGGTDAILYVVRDPRVKRLITWAAVSEATTPWRKWDSDTMAEWKEQGVHYLENKRTNQKLPLYYQLFEDYKANKSKYDVEKAAQALAIPWLICHGSDDESVFVKDAYDLKSWGEMAQVKIVANTGHTFGRSHPWSQPELPPETRELVQATVDFLKA